VNEAVQLINELLNSAAVATENQSEKNPATDSQQALKV